MFSFLLIVCNKALHECIVVLFILVSFFSISQTERIESTKLDSLIWKKINEYRITKKAKPFVVFEDSLMRDFCTRVAYRNFEKKSLCTQTALDTGIMLNVFIIIQLLVFHPMK